MKKHDSNTKLIKILKGAGIWLLAELVLMSLVSALVLGTGMSQDWIPKSSYVVHAVAVFLASLWTAGKQKEGKMVTTLSMAAAILLILLAANLTAMRDGLRGIGPIVIPTAAAAAAAALISGGSGRKSNHTTVRRRK